MEDAAREYAVQFGRAADNAQELALDLRRRAATARTLAEVDDDRARARAASLRHILVKAPPPLPGAASAKCVSALAATAARSPPASGAEAAAKAAETRPQIADAEADQAGGENRWQDPRDDLLVVLDGVAGWPVDTNHIHYTREIVLGGFQVKVALPDYLGGSQYVGEACSSVDAAAQSAAQVAAAVIRQKGL